MPALRYFAWLFGYLGLGWVVTPCAQILSASPVRAPLIAQRIQSSVSAGATAFVDVNVVPMDTERVLSHQTVLVESGRVTALGPMSRVKVPAGAVQIDGRGKYLIPGLADMHAHMTSSQPEGIVRGGREALLFHWLAYGVTTIRVMDRNYEWSKDEILPLRARAASGELVSPRIYTSGGGHLASKSGMGALTEQIVAYKTAGYDFIKSYSERPEIFDSMMAVAHRMGIPVMGHVPDGVSVEQALAAGMKSIEHLTGYYGKNPWDIVNRDSTQFPVLAAATQRAGVWNCPTLAYTEHVVALSRRLGAAQLPVWQRDSIDLIHDRTLALTRKLVKTLHDSGAGLLLGVDAGALLGEPEDMGRGTGTHEELAALVRAGLTPYQALATGTRNVAVFFGTLDSSGTIAVGKRADYVLLDGNPLENIDNTRQITGVMLGGQWLGRNELDRRLAEIKAP